MTQPAEMFLKVVNGYQSGAFDNDIGIIFQQAAEGGFVLLPGEGRPYAEAKNGAYDLDDLLISPFLHTYKSLSDLFAASHGMYLYPEWFAYDPDKHYYQYTEKELCQQFIECKKLTKRKGEYFMDGNPVKRSEVKDALLRTLSIVRTDAGSKLYTTFSALERVCKDEEPDEQRGRLTWQALSEELTARGYEARYNTITGKYEITGETEAGRAMSLDDLVTILHSDLAGTYKGASFDAITQYISLICREHQYNPVLDLLQATTWDGHDRLPELYSIIGITDDELSKKLVHKWLLQTVALLFNDPVDPFGADGCLVFNGKQGAGKTSLFRHLAMRPAWFAEGSSVDDRDKDTTRRIVTTWIAELGEVESTLKSDIYKLKAFITADTDRYRLPYGRSDVEAPRHTSMAATCNDERYLIDPTGNRRWWSIPYTNTPSYEELTRLDALQLWSQIFALVKPLSYKDKAACFRLTADERDQLTIRNGNYEKPTKGQCEVEDILDQAHRDGLTFRQMTVAEFKSEWDVLRPYTVQQIGAALKRCGIESTRTKAARTAELPTRVCSGEPFTR